MVLFMPEKIVHNKLLSTGFVELTAHQSPNVHLQLQTNPKLIMALIDVWRFTHLMHSLTVVFRKLRHSTIRPPQQHEYVDNDHATIRSRRCCFITIKRLSCWRPRSWLAWLHGPWTRLVDELCTNLVSCIRTPHRLLQCSSVCCSIYLRTVT